MGNPHLARPLRLRLAATCLLTLALAAPAILADEPATFRGRSIAQWSADLSHPNSVVRVEAGKMLGRLGNHAGEAVDALIAALNDRNSDVRLHAATALGRIKHNPEKCLAALIRLREDPDEHVRFAAEWSLAWIATDVAATPQTASTASKLDALLAAAETSLAKSFRNPKHLNQVAAARTALRSAMDNDASTDAADLLETPPRHPQAPPMTSATDDQLARLRSDLQADDSLTQLKAIAQLGRLGCAAELVDAWRSTEEYGFLRGHLLRAVAEIGEPACPVLTEALRDNDPLLAIGAARCLGRMGPTAIGALEPLIEVCSDRDVAGEVRESAIRAIGEFGPAAQDAVAPLIQILAREDQETLVEASAWTLGTIGPAARSAEPKLLGILRDGARSDFTRIAAAEALPAINSRSSDVVASLIELLNEEQSPYFASALAGALGGYGEAAAPAVPRLIELVDETSDFERQIVIQALGKIGAPARAATARLVDCLLDVEEVESVQASAAVALARLGPNAITSLAAQLDTSNPRVGETVARALIEIGPRAQPALKPLELRLLDQGGPLEMRALAAVALGQIGTAAQSTIPTLTRILGDVRQAVYLRAMAAVSIGQIDPSQSPTLVAALNDPEPEIRVAAAYALQRLPTPHPDALPMLIREVENDTARGMVMRALSEFADASGPLLTDMMNDASKDDQARIACLTLISEQGVTAAPQLLHALNDETLADPAYWSLRDLGNGTIPLLVKAAEDEEQFNANARGAIHDLINELLDGIGGGEGDQAWTGGHALMDRSSNRGESSGSMATAAPSMSEAPEEPPIALPYAAESAYAPEPEEVMAPQPEAIVGGPRVENGEPEIARLAKPPSVPTSGFKSVKVFYGTNRKPSGDGTENQAGLPWLVWLLIAAIGGAVLVYTVRQFRRGATGRGIAGVASIILLSLAVEMVVARIHRLDQELAKIGPTYGPTYTTDVALGSCEVTIPDIHQEGELERPSIIRLQIVEDPEEHIILKRVQPLARDAFFTELQSELEERGKSILVFVHGYNVSFESAARRTAQMSDDLKFAGAAVFYSWPSQANWRKYRVDEKNVELSVNQLKAFLLDITERSGADTINLIAHSMGNRALTKALKEIEVRSTHQNQLFNQVVLAAPDIDADEFRERIAPAIIPKARHITLYASSKDLALAASREFNSGDPRAGDAGADLVVVPGIDTIDVTAGETSLLGHSYYGDNASVLRDIEFLLRDQPAAAREFLQPYPELAPTHWLFHPTSVARRGAGFEDWR